MPTSIRDNLESILASYSDAKAGGGFGSTNEVWGRFAQLEETFSGHQAVLRRPSLKVRWSVGKGNWAKVPWITFLDERETTSTQSGVYCVYLFRQDMSGAYLTFNQGVTEPQNRHGKAKARAMLRENARDLRRLGGDLPALGFRLDDGIDLRSDPGLGSDYEASTIAYKFYERGAIPDDEALLGDLEAVLRVYDRYLTDEKWAEALDLCASMLADREAFDRQETRYKLDIAARTREVFEPGLDADELGRRLKRAFTNPQNNLTNWQAHDRFLRWAAGNPERAREAVRALADEDTPLAGRVDGFLGPIPKEDLPGPGARISVASFLLMGLDPASYPMYKPTHFGTVEGVLGWPDTLRSDTFGEAYAHHVAFARLLLEELRGSGARDVLDAQSLVWILSTDDRPAVAIWRGDDANLTELLEGVHAWIGALRTQPSPDGLFRYEPLLLLAALEALDGHPGRRNRLPYGELFRAFEKLAAARGSTVSEDQFSQPYLRMGNDVSPLPVWVPRKTADAVDFARAADPAYVRTLAPEVMFDPWVWPLFKSAEHRGLLRQKVEERWPSDGLGPWSRPLEAPPGLEAELQRLLRASGGGERALLAAVFRRAVFLHQKTNTEGFLGAQPHNPRNVSIMIGNLYACRVADRGISLLVPDDERLRERYDVTEAASTGGEMVWIRAADTDRDGLLTLLSDEEAWGRYERMLLRIAAHPVAHSNQNNRGKMDVVSGKRLGLGKTLEELADELLLEPGFLENVIGLLRDKGQVIFYGPPGTGKTFVARKLVEYLAPEESRREVVQFHPSYSYEDFVQGYRPVQREDGNLAYDLKPGPFMRLAAQAASSAAEHVLLIDEINRGNLPKILGELLYLLEYRDDEVVLMYAEEGERFSLPERLLVVGTMNTADRSIALIDAALRRRFHFVPFFPNEAPLKGLLGRWLSRHRPEMGWVAGVLDRLNAELRDRFGPHLQVGPSYFMKKDLDEQALRRVWDHDVMPFLEDQLFGQEEELKNFGLDNLRKRDDEDDPTEGAPAEPADGPDGG